MILALAALAQVPEATVRKILGQRGAKPLVALVWRAHLSMRVAFKIQTLIMKLPARELLPARGGVDFPAEQGRDALASRLFRYSCLRRQRPLRIDMHHDAALAVRGDAGKAGLDEAARTQSRRPLISNS